jgi:MoaA/NifB/PqqE/SkfB family radical SAM enzyme
MKTFPDALQLGISATYSALTRRRVLSCLWELTYRCNARCRICSYWKSPSSPEEELSTKQIALALPKLRSAGCRMINFTGGEPTLRRDLEEIVANASRLGFWTSIVTNGSTLTRERVLRLKQAGLDNLFISLDSPDPARHDASRGIPGLHAKVMRNLQWLREEFLTGHRTGGVFSVLTQDNATDISRILQLAEQAGVFAILQPYHSAKTGNTSLSPRHISDLQAALTDLRRRHYCLLSSESYLRGIGDFLAGGSRPRCNAGAKYFSLDPFGYLHPCVDGPRVGHVLSDDLGVLQGPAAREAVDSCEGCWYCFRGEADTTLKLQGYFEKVATVSRVLKTNVSRGWRRPVGWGQARRWPASTPYSKDWRETPG